MVLGADGQCSATYWGGRTRTSNFPVNSRAVCQLTYTPNKLDVQTSRRGDVQDRQTTTQRSILQARLLRKTLHRLLLLGAQLLGQRDVCLHVHVPPPAVLFDAVTRDAEFLAVLRARWNP